MVTGWQSHSTEESEVQSQKGKAQLPAERDDRRLGSSGFTNSEEANQADGRFHLRLSKQAKWLPNVCLSLKRTSAPFSLARLLSFSEHPHFHLVMGSVRGFSFATGDHYSWDEIFAGNHSNQNFPWSCFWRCHPPHTKKEPSLNWK